MTTVKNGCAAQSNIIQPKIASLSGSRFDSEAISATWLFLCCVSRQLGILPLHIQAMRRARSEKRGWGFWLTICCAAAIKVFGTKDLKHMDKASPAEIIAI